MGRVAWTRLLHAVLDTPALRAPSFQTILRGLLMRVLLASSSPRRRALLSLLLDHFDTFAPDIDETVFEGEAPEKYVARLAIEKARTCAAESMASLGADTAVAIGNQILGKPRDAQEARHILTTLSDTTHKVHTAVALAYAGDVHTLTSSTSVTFTKLSDTAIHEYLLTDEPWDKAGGYAIQGYAGAFVSRISGSYSAVVGMPLCETRELLLGAGIQVRHG